VVDAVGIQVNLEGMVVQAVVAQGRMEVLQEALELQVKVIMGVMELSLELPQHIFKEVEVEVDHLL
jgi:hypothetical protein